VSPSFTRFNQRWTGCALSSSFTSSCSLFFLCSNLIALIMQPLLPRAHSPPSLLFYSAVFFAHRRYRLQRPLLPVVAQPVVCFIDCHPLLLSSPHHASQLRRFLFIPSIRLLSFHPTRVRLQPDVLHRHGVDEGQAGGASLALHPDHVLFPPHPRLSTPVTGEHDGNGQASHVQQRKIDTISLHGCCLSTVTDGSLFYCVSLCAWCTDPR
jgi:hypothetical protein